MTYTKAEGKKQICIDHFLIGCCCLCFAPFQNHQQIYRMKQRFANFRKLSNSICRWVLLLLLWFFHPFVLSRAPHLYFFQHFPRNPYRPYGFSAALFFLPSFLPSVRPSFLSFISLLVGWLVGFLLMLHVNVEV